MAAYSQTLIAQAAFALYSKAGKIGADSLTLRSRLSSESQLAVVGNRRSLPFAQSRNLLSKNDSFELLRKSDDRFRRGCERLMAANSGDTPSTRSRRRKVPQKQTEEKDEQEDVDNDATANDDDDDDDDDDVEMSDKALNDLFKQLAKDLGEDDIDMDAELTEEEMLQFEKELNKALAAAERRNFLDEGDDSDADFDDDGEEGITLLSKNKNDEEEDEEDDVLSYFEESEDELEDVSLSLDDFDRGELQRARETLQNLLDKMEGAVGEQNAKKGGPFSELKWSPKRTKATNIAVSYVTFFIEADLADNGEGEAAASISVERTLESGEQFEIDEDEVQTALKVLEQVRTVYDRREKNQARSGDELLANLGVDLDGLEAASSILEQIMAAGEPLEDEDDVEDGADLKLLSEDEDGDVIDIEATVVDKEVKQLGNGVDKNKIAVELDGRVSIESEDVKEGVDVKIHAVASSAEREIEEEEEEGEGDNFEVDDYNVEDIIVAVTVFDKLLVKMQERKKAGGEVLRGIGKELEWTRKVETTVKKTAQMLRRLEEINKEVDEGLAEEGGEIEADGEEIQLALDVVDGILESVEDGIDGKTGVRIEGSKVLQLLELTYDELETTAAFLRQIVEEGDEEYNEDDESEESEGLDSGLNAEATADGLEPSDLVDAKEMETGVQEKVTENIEGSEIIGQAGSREVENGVLLDASEQDSKSDKGGGSGVSGQQEKLGESTGEEEENGEVLAALGAVGLSAGAAIVGQGIAPANKGSSEKKREEKFDSPDVFNQGKESETFKGEEKRQKEKKRGERGDLPEALNSTKQSETAVEESVQEDDTRRRVQLARWQLKKLAAAVKLGRRNVNIRELVGATKLDRRDVLAFLANPPPGLDELDLGVEKDEEGEAQNSDMSGTVAEKSGGKQKALEEEEEEEADEMSAAKGGPWTPDVQKDWHGRKRLRKEHIATFEKIYQGNRYPTGAMVQNLVELTHVPRRRVLEWFSERREQDKPRSSYRSLTPIDPVRPNQKQGNAS